MSTYCRLWELLYLTKLNRDSSWFFLILKLHFIMYLFTRNMKMSRSKAIACLSKTRTCKLKTWTLTRSIANRMQNPVWWKKQKQTKQRNSNRWTVKLYLPGEMCHCVCFAICPQTENLLWSWNLFLSIHEEKLHKQNMLKLPFELGIDVDGQESA